MSKIFHGPWPGSQLALEKHTRLHEVIAHTH